MRWIIAAVLAVVLCVCLCFGVACKSKTNEDAVGEGTYFTKTDPAGKKPEEGYSGNDYVNYIAYVLEQQTEWYAVSDSQANASINSQQIWTDKYYKDGYMLTTQKSKSSFSNEAFEVLFVTGRQGSANEERGAYLRDGSKPKNKDHDFSDITWDDGEPTYYLEEDYYFLHGLFSDEMSVFLINDETIEKADEVIKNSDGTYSQHFVLDTDDSVYYYQYSMKNHGGLSTFPAFSKVEVTMTFNEAFELLKLETTEESKVRKAGSNWTNKTTATTTYTYRDMKDEENFNEEDFAAIWTENSGTLNEAKDYFEKYYNKIEASTDREIVYTPDASDVLMGALGGALTSEGETYKMYVNYNDEIDASGYIYFAIDLENWEDLTFDFSGFSTMDWVSFALEAYQYAHIIVEVDSDDGDQALIVDLLSGNNILEILAGKLIEVYIGEGALGSGLTEEEITEGVDGLTVKVFTAIADALADEEIVEDSSDVDMSLEYGPLGRLATVTLDMDAFYMNLECYELWTFSGSETIYEYELIQATIEIPSIGLSIVLTPVTGDKMSYVTPNETATESGSTMGSMGLETLVMDLINSVLNLSSSSYINDSYTFSGDIAVDMDLSAYSLGKITIEIDNMVITIGDVLDDFYISFVGDLQESKFTIFTIATASTIGLTWCGDYIVMAKDLQTATPTYRVMTTKDFGKYALDSDADISPIAWLLGTGSTAWAIVAGMFSSSSSSGTNETSLVQTLATGNQSLFDWLNIGYYVSGMEVKLGGELGASIGDIDVNGMFGLTDDYWVFVLGDGFISSVTAGYVDSAAIAITQSMSQLGGIYIVGSVFGLMDLTLNLNYETNLKSEYDMFGGNIVLGIEEEQTVVDEDGSETTETVVVVDAQIVPNLFNVFMENLKTWGADDSDFDYEDVKNTEMTILYTANVIFTYEGAATADGSFVCYEYTVGDDFFLAYYYHEAVTGTDKDGGSKDFDAGAGYVKHELEDYPSEKQDSDE